MIALSHNRTHHYCSFTLWEDSIARCLFVHFGFFFSPLTTAMGAEFYLEKWALMFLIVNTVMEGYFGLEPEQSGTHAGLGSKNTLSLPLIISLTRGKLCRLLF